MSAPVRLAAFALVLAATFTVAAGVGSAVGPVGPAAAGPSTPDPSTPDEMTQQMSGAHR